MFRVNLQTPIGIACLAAVLALGGCSGLPTSGPTGAQVVNQANAESSPNFGIVDVTTDIAEFQSARGRESLRARFGDYRGAPGLLIGPGDIIAVTLWEAPPGALFGATANDRTGGTNRTARIPDQMVGRDGAITVPFAGRIPVTGRTPMDVQRTIVDRLAGKAVEPQALVSVTKSLGSTVSVTGEVTAGARIPLSPNSERVMDVIAAAGGVKAPVHESYVRITRGSGAAKVALSTILTNPSENIFVRPGDVITVVRDPQSFTVIGATGRNQTIPFDAQGISFAEALAKSGGFLDYRSDPQAVFVLRFEPYEIARKMLPAGHPLVKPGHMTPIAYRFDMMNASNLFLAQRFAVLNKDIVYVANAPLAELQKILMIVQSVTSPVVTGVSVGTALR